MVFGAVVRRKGERAKVRRPEPNFSPIEEISRGLRAFSEHAGQFAAPSVEQSLQRASVLGSALLEALATASTALRREGEMVAEVGQHTLRRAVPTLGALPRQVGELGGSPMLAVGAGWRSRRIWRGIRRRHFTLFSRASVLSVGSVGSFGGFLSVLSINSVGSLLSIGSSGSVLSIGSVGSVLSIGSAGCILCIGSRGDLLNRRKRRLAEQASGADDRKEGVQAAHEHQASL